MTTSGGQPRSRMLCRRSSTMGQERLLTPWRRPKVSLGAAAFWPSAPKLAGDPAMEDGSDTPRAEEVVRASEPSVVERPPIVRLRDVLLRIDPNILK